MISAKAAMAAAKYGLDNLFVIVDKNKLQLAGLTADIMPLDPLDVKWAAFGFRVSECDGNDVGQLIEALALAIARGLLDRLTEMRRCRITVRKPSAPIAGILDHVQVSVEQFRR